jgi:hypothetical protein
MIYGTVNMKRLLLCLLLAVSGSNGYGQYSSVSFYVVAHPDQWQLFMGVKACGDIMSKGTNGPGRKVVIIYTTAGDESCSGAPLNVPYYLARRDGANRCVEFFADQTSNHELWTSGDDTTTGHRILRTQYKNVTCYHLKLTGGCPDKGFMGQSLQDFHSGTIPAITAVDSSASYTRWSDLVQTVQEIINNESDSSSDIRINTADTDRVINPGEHPDRIHTAHLALQAAAGIPHVTLNLFEENNITNKPANLSNKDIATKAALLSQLDFGRTENGQTSEWDAVHISYTSRSYFRTITR